MKIVNLQVVPEAIMQLAEWHHAEWSYLNPRLSLAQRSEKMENYLSDAFIPSTYVAMDNGEIVGSAAIVESDMDTHKHFSPWLASVYVDFTKRRGGVGSRLVRHVMDEAKKQNTKKLYLFTPDQVNFYQRLGWQFMFKESYRESEVSVMCIELE